MLKDKLLRRIPVLQYIKGLTKLKSTLKERKMILEKCSTFENRDAISMDNDTLEIFKRAFLKFIWIQSYDMEIAHEFFEAEVFPKKISSNVSLNQNDPILICVVKNDFQKIQLLVDYYRNLGIKKLVFVDNQSNDGTFEFLLEQNDVDLYVCKAEFSDSKKMAWTNRVIAHYGFDRWYLLVDSDEFLTYLNCETKKISELVQELENKRQYRMLVFLLDMYSKKCLFESMSGINMMKEYCYFDNDTYHLEKHYRCEKILGGPRERIFFQENSNFDALPLLTKYPLFKFKKGDIQCSPHYLFPYKDNYDLPIMGVFLHYKFLSTDLQKYQEIAEKDSMHDYKFYFHSYTNNHKIKFYGSHSKKYICSKDLLQLKIKYNGEEYKAINMHF